jgi:bifunctional UDP-N-acetylglucosamine pyrophosphorylase/glucosamine-1-phosphate N-acetyltransferase
LSFGHVLTIVLAAGKSTRMLSSVPKVLHKLGGLPILGYVLKAVAEIKPDRTVVVLSKEGGQVEEYLKENPVDIVYQEEQLGTGHAVLCNEAYLKNFDGAVLILYGDTPLITSDSLIKALKAFNSFSPSPPTAMVIGMSPSDPKSYGRIILDDQGNVRDIIESKNADPQTLKNPLCNSGMMILDGGRALALLKAIEPDTKTGEYYLTDVVKVAHLQGLPIGFYHAESAIEFEGINNRRELAWAEAQLQHHWRTLAMDKGVTLVDPNTVYFSYDTQIEADVTVYPHVFFGPGVKVERGVEIMSFTHLEGACIKSKSKIGPYARLRPGTLVGEKGRVGNFVEIKNAVCGPEVKVNHLSYIGDAEVGEKTNVGAGTITCNYDGYKKWKTKIGSQVLVGANSSLIAPLTIGHGAVIAAGSIVAQDVKEEALAISRPQQVEINQGGKRFHERKQKNKLGCEEKEPV